MPAHANRAMSRVDVAHADPGGAAWPGALSAALQARVAEAAGAGPIRTLAPGDAVEMPCPAPPDPAALAAAIADAPVDAAVTPAEHRRKRLLIADMDSTIVTGETLDELAAFAGVGDRVAAITRRSMNGELDFAAALRERVALLEGLQLDCLERTWAGVRLTPGARTLVQTMRAHGAVTALVSGGFTWFTARVAAQCGFACTGPTPCWTMGGCCWAGSASRCWTAKRSSRRCWSWPRRRAYPPADCLAVGDGANDLAMIGAAGLGVAFHAKPVVAAEARVRVRFADLRALLFVQGYAAEEFVA